jgi:hypothetical protein
MTKAISTKPRNVISRNWPGICSKRPIANSKLSLTQAHLTR